MDISVKCCKQCAGKEEYDDRLEREKRANVMGYGQTVRVYERQKISGTKIFKLIL